MNVAPATARESAVDVAISLVNHSNPDLLIACLRSLYASTRKVTFEVWVVDNATDQRGVSEMQAEFPRIRWLFNKRRLGFSANHNQVLTRAHGRYYCILNDDTIIHELALDELVAFFDAHPRIGIAGPRLLNSDGSIQTSAFRFTSAWFQIIEQCWLPPPLVRLKARGVHPAQRQNEPRPVDWLLGACLVMRSDTLAQVGMLDDVLAPVGNLEDIDWCRRVHAAGFEVWLVPDSKITHYGGQSYWINRTGVDRMRVEMARANLRYFRKHEGQLIAVFIAIIYLLVLPWNLFMLFQMAIRGRLRWSATFGEMGTSVAIATAGLRFLVGYAYADSAL